MGKISTGSPVLDHLLEGGLDDDIISTIYGPAGSGKTTICLLCAIQAVKDGKKVLYIDTEGGFSVERLKQLAPDFKRVLDNILFLKPSTFDEQKKEFVKLNKLVDTNIGLVIVDSMVMLYRLELGKSEQVYETNRELGKQLSTLVQVCRKKNVPVLVTNQVYADFNVKDKVNMVGGDILKYWSKCLIELQITPDKKRRAVLRRHRSLPDERDVTFEIKHTGLLSARASKGFRIF